VYSVVEYSGLALLFERNLASSFAVFWSDIFYVL